MFIFINDGGIIALKRYKNNFEVQVYVEIAEMRPE